MKLTVVLALLIGTLVLACSTVTPVPAEPTSDINIPTVLETTPDIDATVEDRLAEERASQPTVQAQPTNTQAPSPATTPIRQPTNTPSAVPVAISVPTPTPLYL